MSRSDDHFGSVAGSLQHLAQPSTPKNEPLCHHHRSWFAFLKCLHPFHCRSLLSGLGGAHVQTCRCDVILVGASSTPEDHIILPLWVGSQRPCTKIKQEKQARITRKEKNNRVTLSLVLTATPLDFAELLC